MRRRSKAISPIRSSSRSLPERHPVHYTIHHLTKFSYETPVRESIMEVRMQPRTEGVQRCARFGLSTTPGARVKMYDDRDGNTVHHFNIPGRHSRLIVTAEALIEGGSQLPMTDESARLFAEALARLVTLAPPVVSLPSLEPSLPWVGWDHNQGGTWPEPDDIEADLNAHVGPRWIEDAGVRVRRRLLLPSALPIVVGHADWESQNLRWINRRLHVVHDWDSIVGQRESTIAGAASAVFTATGAPNTSASVEQSESFLVAYARARGHPWTEEERELAWAAGLWVRVFNAKKATLRPDGETPSPSRLRLEAEVGARLRQAGA